MKTWKISEHPNCIDCGIKRPHSKITRVWQSLSCRSCVRKKSHRVKGHNEQKKFNPKCKKCGVVRTKSNNTKHFTRPFCRSCSAVEMWKERKKPDLKCKKCGKNFPFSQSKGRARVYCSKECRSSLIEKQCEICGNFFSVPASNIVRYKRCSMQCSRLFSGETSIEEKTRKILESLKIDFEQEFFLQGFYYDFFIPSKNTLIECDGNYWHSLPKAKKRDRIKNFVAKKNKFQLLRFTETFINSDGFENQFKTIIRGVK